MSEMNIQENINFLPKVKEASVTIPRSTGGVISLESFEKIAKTVKKYNIPIIKISSDQKIILIGIKETDVSAVKNELGMPEEEEILIF